jgi:FkbM family methyltransferase
MLLRKNAYSTLSSKVSPRSCKVDQYFANHTKEFQNIDLKASDIKTMVSPESKLMDAIVESLPHSFNSTRTVLVDIGGNKGDMTAMMRAKWGSQPTIHTFDVISDFVERLHARFQGDDRICMHYNAVSNEDGKVAEILGESSWKLKGAIHTGASLLSRGDGYKAVIERVPTITLDRFFENKSMPEGVSFLKIDTEGNDYNVLLGACKALKGQKISVLFFENNQMQAAINASLYKTVRYLESVGYNTYYFSNMQLFPLNELCEESDIFSYAGTGNGVALPKETSLELSVVERYKEKRRLAFG